MSYLYSEDKTQEFSDQALRRIEEDGLMPIPENYELWFVYYSNSDPNLKMAVEAALKSSSDKITDEQCYDLFQKYLGTHREEKSVKQAGDKIQKTMNDVNKAVTSAGSQAKVYQEDLNSMRKELSKDKTKEEIDTLLSGAVTSTNDMIEHNKALEDQIESSAKMIEEMRRDLEIARKEAMTDALTGLANRKAFDVEVDRLVNVSIADEARTFSMILMDIDHFKNFNDKFGHQVGDQVLKLVARTLKDGVKGRDLAVRYGGEEFAILLPDTNIQGGLKVAELLRQEVEKKEVINRATGKILAKITLSGGVSEYHKKEKVSSLVGRVDSALYDAKNSGRNQISSST